MKNGIILTLVTAATLTFGFSNAAMALWRVNLDKSGTTYGIKSGGAVIDMGLTQRQANKLAKKLNQIEKKDKKEAEE